MTPEQLATELGISGKTLRAWLRRNFPRPAAQKGSSWTLTPKQSDAARAWRSGSHQAMRGSAAGQPPSREPPTKPQREIRWDPRFEGSFRRQRFRGFVPLGQAVADRTEFLFDHESDLDSAGVYAIFAPIDWSPKWKTRGHFLNVIAPWPLARLRDRWVENVELIYIGCAGATASSRKLSKRIGDLLKHGAGQISTNGPHKGGERLWQCTGWEAFTLAWKTCGPYPEPHDLEIAIGRRFEHLTGQLPFANVRL